MSFSCAVGQGSHIGLALVASIFEHSSQMGHSVVSAVAHIGQSMGVVVGHSSQMGQSVVAANASKSGLFVVGAVGC